MKRHRVVEKKSYPPGLEAFSGKPWRKKAQRIRKLLLHGQQYGKRITEGILSSNIEDVARMRSSGGANSSTLQELPASLFPKSMKKMEEGTWGQAAKAQFKALRGVVKTLEPVEVAE